MTIPIPFLFEPARSRHSRFNGTEWVEQVLLITAEGFEKTAEVNVYETYLKVPKCLPMEVIMSEPEGSMIEQSMVFLRTLDRTHDGRVIFRQDPRL